jgi:carbamoyl-phosphate synthase small subunit
VVDCGVKYNILRLLAQRDCQVTVLPATATAEQVLATNPDGVLFSPGPGDPVHTGLTVATAQAIIDRVPTMGICLGHQIIARALGAQTYKLKFGHRGGNHPVQEFETGLVSITAQNHGYAVSDDHLPDDVIVTHRNLRHRDRPVITIQYHSEASPGPLDNEHIFDQFLAMVKER